MKNRLLNKDSFAALRLETLIRIRWLAVIGQIIAVLVVYFGLKFEFLIIPCLAFIALSAALNLYLKDRFPENARWEGLSVVALLGYDIMQLAALLYLTGGIQNPFSALLAVPVVISASSQRVQYTVILFSWAICAVTFLMFVHEPLPWYFGFELIQPMEIKFGVWSSIIAMMGFTSVYTYRVANESRKLAEALAATELVLQHEQHVSNLDGLSTAAAHELGTPLATIALVSKEMMREIPKESPLYDDAALLRSQAGRCRDILQKISSLSSESDDNVARLSIELLMEEITAPHRDFDVVLDVKGEGPKPSPQIQRDAAVLYGLGNIIENAVDFATSKVTFSAKWDEEKVVFVIEDDGQGFSTELLSKIGEPYLTTRGATKRETGGGLGLGVFIAKTLLERNGAELVFSNRKSDDEDEIGITGASVTITWERDKFDQGRMGI